jgi:hypothetical protein
VAGIAAVGQAFASHPAPVSHPFDLDSNINRLSTGTGCITARRQVQGKVSIEGLLLRSEGSNAQCPID